MGFFIIGMTVLMLEKYILFSGWTNARHKPWNYIIANKCPNEHTNHNAS